MAAGSVVWWHGLAVQSGGIGRFAGWKVMARLRRAGREAAGLEGVSPALRAWASNFSLRGQRKVTKRKATPTYSPDLRRVPSAHPLVRRHAPTGHPCPGAARSTSCLAAWTSGLASANKRGNQDRACHNLRGIVGCNKRSALHRFCLVGRSRCNSLRSLHPTFCFV